MNTTTTTTARIYVACLAAYNNGILHGKWIDASSDESEMQEAVDAMLAESPIEDAEEWAIHDCEGFAHLDEYEDFDVIAERVGHWETYGQDEVEAYEGYFGQFDPEDFLDRYAGGCRDYHSDRRRFACEQFEELMLCDYTEEQRDTFWSHADEDSILRWFEDWNVFVEDKTPTPSNQASWCYIFRTDI